MFGEKVIDRFDLPFSVQELTLLKAALAQQINCPRTSSAGRLFDAVASLLDIAQINHYEGQAAMALEALATGFVGADFQAFPSVFKIIDGAPLIIDWQPAIENVLMNLGKKPPALIAAQFHHTLAEMLLAIANRAERQNIVLSGGCMQNAYLVAEAIQGLENAGFTVYCHGQIPPNDGGLAVGQLYAGKFLEM